MAISSNNLFTDGIRGTVGGNMTFRRRRSGKVIVSRRRGPSQVPATEAQIATRNRFKIGTIYAKAAMSDPALKALYAAAAGPDQLAHNIALKDACVSPQVTAIDAARYHGQPGNAIVVRAIDDFAVIAVKVSIHKADGNLLEEGQAVLQVNGLDWQYSATVESDAFSGGTITAMAQDRPGNTGTLEITL